MTSTDRSDISSAAPTDVETILVTPDMAEEWLKLGREISSSEESKVRAYADEMRGGRWKLSGDTIVFSRSDHLFNGKLRLKAVVRSGIPQPFIVVRGISDLAAPTIDQHLRRSFATMLEASGQKNARLLSRTISKILKIEAGQVWDQHAIPWNILDRTMHANPAIIKAVDWAAGKRHHWLKPPILAVLHFMLRNRKGLLEKLMASMLAGDSATPGGAAAKLLQMARDSGARVLHNQILALAVDAANDMIADKPAGRYRLLPEGKPFPKLAGYSALKEPTKQRSKAVEHEQIDIQGVAHTLSHEWISITPQMARDMLKHNSGNRTLVARQVDGIKRDLQRGEWINNGQAICFSNTGRLLNGQHRLNGIIEADVPAETLVIRGFREDVFLLFDRHVRKTVSIDGMLSTGDENLCAAVARMVWADEHRDLFEQGQRAQASEIHDVLTRHPGIILNRSYARTLEHLARGRVLVYCAHRILSDNEELGRLFLTMLKDGDEIPKSENYVTHLRDKLMTTRAIRRKIDYAGQVRSIIATWIQFRDHRLGRDRKRRAQLEEAARMTAGAAAAETQTDTDAAGTVH